MRKRLRSTIKWAGTVLTVLLLVVWVGSGWWWCNFTPRSASYATAIDRGTLAVKWVKPAPTLPDKYLGWHMGWNRPFRFSWWFRSESGTVVRGGNATEVVVPLWLGVLIFGLPTTILWYRDRRKPLRVCRKCAYDLRGNTSGVCPECGAGFDEPRP